MTPEIVSAITWFEKIMIDGVRTMVARDEMAFLSVMCSLSAIDALSGYRAPLPASGARENGRDRFRAFVDEYMRTYRPHSDRLYDLRCRMLHNFSPAYFFLVHNEPTAHLTLSKILDTILNAGSFHADVATAARTFFDHVRADPARQRVMHDRLMNVRLGGSIYVA